MRHGRGVGMIRWWVDSHQDNLLRSTKATVHPKLAQMCTANQNRTRVIMSEISPNYCQTSNHRFIRLGEMLQILILNCMLKLRQAGDKENKSWDKPWGDGRETPALGEDHGQKWQLSVPRMSCEQEVSGMKYPKCWKKNASTNTDLCKFKRVIV